MKHIGENALKKWTSLVKSDIKKKLDKNQGTANSGKILGVDATGEVAPTDTEVATLVDVPNGLLKGDGTTISAAVAETDYMAPPTGGTDGQVLTKTADGQEWKDREEDIFVVNMTMNEGKITSADKTFDEVQTAHNAGKTVIANIYLSQISVYYILPSTTFQTDQDIAFTAVSGDSSISVIMTPTDIITQITGLQNQIIAKGILKGDGEGSVSAATAGTDYIASGNIVKQTLVATETTPTENYAINWVYG